MKLAVNKYWELFAHFVVAIKAHEQVLANTKVMEEILPENEPKFTRLQDNLTDVIYGVPVVDYKKVFDEIISTCGIDVEWVVEKETEPSS